jgi:arylsulfatase
MLLLFNSLAQGQDKPNILIIWGDDIGPLTKKRMETADEEFLAASLKFIDKAHRNKKPFFVWFNSTRMHVWTRLKPESQGVTGQGLYADGMVEHDGHVGQLLAKLDELGIADNTIVMYSTDNGAELALWPDGGYTPYRGEKNSNWEGDPAYAQDLQPENGSI